MPADIPTEFRLARTGLWFGNTALRQQLTREQVQGLFGEFPRVLNVGGHNDSPHKVLVFDNVGLYAVYDDEKQRVMSVTIVWRPEAVDYPPAHPFTGVCWLNNKQLRSELQLSDAPLNGEITFRKFLRGDYSAFFDHYYAQLRFVPPLKSKGVVRSSRTLVSLHFSFSTADLPRDFVAERVDEQPSMD